MSFVLKTINGDLFNATCSLAHCVGADFRMGAGIAIKFREIFGQVENLKSQKVRKSKQLLKCLEDELKKFL